MDYDKCIVCKNTRMKPNVSLFRFPLNEKRCKEWILACKLSSMLNEPSDKMYNKYRVCSEHFQDEDYKSPNHRALKSTAIPSNLESFFEPSIDISKMKQSLRNKIGNISVRGGKSIALTSERSILQEAEDIKEEFDTLTNISDISNLNKSETVIALPSERNSLQKAEDVEEQCDTLTNTADISNLIKKEKQIIPYFCSAYGCRNRSGSPRVKERSISFHQFPLTDKMRLKLWLVNMARKNFQPTCNSRICSEHFSDEDFEYQHFTNRRGLKNTAIPTKFSFSGIDTDPYRYESKVIQQDICQPVVTTLTADKSTQTVDSLTCQLLAEIRRLKAENVALRGTLKKFDMLLDVLT